MTSDILKRAAEAVEGVTPGPWTVWEEKTATADDAKAELASQVDDTDGFCGAVFMLNAFGKCPALTGCGPTSKANVHFIAAARTLIPDMAAAIAERDAEIKRLTADLARSEAAKYRYKLRGDNHWETMRCIYWIATAEGDIQAIIQHIEDAGSGYMERPEETLRRYQTDLAAMTARAEAAEAQVANAGAVMVEAALRLPAYDSDGDPAGQFDHHVFVRRDDLRALSTLSPISAAAGVLLADDVAISRMAEAIHDGPLGAKGHWFSAATKQGGWCVDVARAALRALAEQEKAE